MELYRTLKGQLKGSVKFKEPLFKHTSFSIGGPAELWVEPKDEKDLRCALLFSMKNNLKFFVIGSGSNVLASDNDIEGIIVRLSAPAFKKIDIENRKVTVGAGALLSHLILSCCEKSLGGLEGLAGIPGTVGGAVRMNSSYKNTISEFITKVKVMDKNGKIFWLRKNKLKFGYRFSNLSNSIIIETEFLLKKAKKEKLFERYNSFLKSKKTSQPWNEKSAGCIFRNPPESNFSAGKLIELCGLKGKACGGAKISEKHANFIVNEKKAKCSDVKYLVKLIQKKVKKRFDVKLKPEIVTI